MLLVALFMLVLTPLFVKFVTPALALALLVVLVLGAAALHATRPPSGAPRWHPETGGAVLEILTGFTTAAGTTQTDLTMSTGDSKTVREADPAKKVLLLNTWVDGQANVGTLRIRSPKLHDVIQGIRLGTNISEVRPLLPMTMGQRLFKNDNLTVDLSGSATAGDIDTAALLLYYEDLMGGGGNFISLDELLKRGVNYEGVENTLALGTAGGWSGAEAINAEYDNLKANTDYALVGFLTDTECAALAWRGANTGNYRVGGPGNELEKEITRDWFIHLTRGFGYPLIPVFNSNNKGAIMLDGSQDENGADPKVTTILVELAPK